MLWESGHLCAGRRRPPPTDTRVHSSVLADNVRIARALLIRRQRSELSGLSGISQRPFSSSCPYPKGRPVLVPLHNLPFGPLRSSRLDRCIFSSICFDCLKAQKWAMCQCLWFLDSNNDCLLPENTPLDGLKYVRLLGGVL